MRVCVVKNTYTHRTHIDNVNWIGTEFRIVVILLRRRKMRKDSCIYSQGLHQLLSWFLSCLYD